MSPKNENASRAARCASSFATMRLNGQHTGSTDLLLTENGEKRAEITKAIREWDYGDCEGMKSEGIREQRARNGMGRGIFGGMDVHAETKPLGRSAHEVPKRDDLVVAHGHISRAFAMRWIGKPLTETAFMLEAGGVGTLSYEHHNIDEPAILLGGAFDVDD
ncbi:uncharacterized protein PADG_04677 [Paracoccidioides brasiliensis Pb18]|uniref:Uncharacterized protein n=1 Tax=Paracoccidioides brasiliensis (strain Pb18) TaxID=502780 RepID=C1GCF5_PARBD|nr:uncharacterized protein PADG_04677 [Paracoccidioides brasiliensis Pb18]EEH48598.1 hypothetical protein PADG_04677 [Paracoccidioides brasiliensis Pb18]